jgi:diguanylate cyclase (GGDEF)-like protein
VHPALAIDERTAHRTAFGQCHLAAGMAYRRLGMLDEAETHLLAARRRVDRFTIGPSLALVLGELAELHSVRGDHVAAFDALREAHAIELEHARGREDRLVESVMARVHLQVADCEMRRRTDEMADLERTNAELRALAEGLWVASFEDALTGLPNRRSLDDRMRLLHSQAVLRPLTLSVAIIDVDNFKLVNDHYSHAAGDEALRLMGAILRRHCRATDLVARYGGEEFIVLLERTDQDEAAVLAERLRQAVEESDWSTIHPGLQLTISAGVAGASSVTDPAALLQEADRRLLAAKNSGRNVVIAA